MKSRTQLLASLLSYDAPVAQIAGELKKFPWDAETALVTLARENVIQVLERYLRGELEASKVEEWANAIEAREDISFEAGYEEALQEAIYQLANPLLTMPLTTELMQQIKKNLMRGLESDF